MATGQETKELSMAEILSSIREILEENGAAKDLYQPKAEKDDEVIELNSSMIAEDKPQALSQNIPVFAAQEKNSEACRPQAQTTANANDYAPYREQAKSSVSPYAAMQNSENIREVPSEAKAQTFAPIETYQTASVKDSPLSDVSEEIVNSFTKMFEQNDFGYHKNTSTFNAETLLKQIVEQAVEERLDNRVLLNMVKETVVPVLSKWLSCYLPQLVAEEVNRVMVKAGKR